MRLKQRCILTAVISIIICSISVSGYAWHTLEEGPYKRGQKPTTIYSVVKDDSTCFDEIIEKDVYLKSTEFKNSNILKVKNENGYIETWYNEKPVYMYIENENLKYGCARSCFLADDVNDAMKKGWMTSEQFSLELYNPDGTSKRIYGNDIEEAFENGWYLYPVKYLYKADGTKEVFSESNVSQQLENGWYEFPVCILYGADGREIIIKEEEREKYLNDGYRENIDGMKILYAPDGRQKLVYENEVSAELENGWFTQRVCMIYNEYGDSSLVYEYELDMYRQLGWFSGEDTKTLYAPDGRSETVAGKDVYAQLSVGWYSYPVVTVYSADGRSMIISQTELEAYKKVGWDDTIITMYSADGRELEVPLIQVELYRAVNWMTIDTYITLELDGIVAEYGYAYAVSKIETIIEDTDDVYVLEFFFNERERLLNEWRSVNGCPIAVIGWDIGENSIGTPEISIKFRNLSDKTITAFKTKFTCYDDFGNVTTDYPYLHNGTIEGSVNRETLKPDLVWTSTWSLYSNEQTAKISWPIITQIAFDDGTTWYR